MHAIHPVMAPPAPSHSNGAGSERTDHATSARAPEPAVNSETARPPTAPEKAEQSERYSADRARAAEPAKARPDTVVAARSAEVSQERSNREARADKAEPEAAPDPMVPPVPMKYLSKLLQAHTASAQPDQAQEAANSEAADHAPMAVIAASEKAAEANSSLDVLL